MKHGDLDQASFEEILESIREGGAILRGQRKPSRRFIVEASSVRAIREPASLSQTDFEQSDWGPPMNADER